MILNYKFLVTVGNKAIKRSGRKFPFLVTLIGKWRLLRRGAIFFFNIHIKMRLNAYWKTADTLTQEL